MKPSAMLVGAFEIQIRRKASLLRVRAQVLFPAFGAAHHGLMCHARVEPDVEGVAQLPVARLVDAEVFARRCEPCFDAAPCDLRGCELEQGHRVRVERVGFPIDEKWQRYSRLT